MLAKALAMALYAIALTPMVADAQAVINPNETVDIPGTYPSPWTPGALKIEGRLTIRDGGMVTSPSSRLGVAVTSGTPAASAFVEGAGSIWNTGRLEIGSSFSEFNVGGAMTIRDGGVVNSTLGYLGLSIFNGQGSVTIQGQDSAWNVGELGVGYFRGNGQVRVLDGGLLSSTESATVGYFTWGLFDRATSLSNVVIDGSGSRWNANGGVVIRKGSEVSVSNSGTLTASTIKLSGGGTGGLPSINDRGGMLTIGGLVSYNAQLPASAPVAPGVVVVDAIEFESQGGTVNFNHTADDYVFNARLFGSGVLDSRNSPPTINAFAGGTRLVADNSAFLGVTSVFNGARLWVDNKLGGNVFVREGGKFGGNGAVLGDVTVDIGGRLAPGNSIGTLTVNGDLTFAAGSIYEVEVTPQGASDQVAVGGKAVINGGSVISVGQDSGFKPFTQYTILTAGGGVSGQFASASNNYAFLNPSLVYEPNAVKLQLLRNDVSFGSVGVTANQRAVASGAESTGPGHPVWNAIAVLSADQARAALDSLSGELHASNQTALIEDALSIQHAVLDGYAGSEQRGYMGVWIKALGARAQIDATRETAKLERDSSGVLFGADWALDEHWRLGALAGGGKTRNDVDALDSRSESDNLHYGLYADAAWQSGWRLRLGAIRSDYDVDTRRRAPIAGLGSNFTATTDARATQFYGELGYRFAAGAVELEPFLGASQIKLDTDDFREYGGVGALRGEDVDATTRYSTLGLRLGYGFGDNSRWRLGGSLAWRRASGDLEPVAKLRFDGGQSFLIDGAPIARSAAVVTAGVSARLSENTSLDLSYLGQIASDADDHGASAKLTFRF